MDEAQVVKERYVDERSAEERTDWVECFYSQGTDARRDRFIEYLIASSKSPGGRPPHELECSDSWERAGPAPRRAWDALWVLAQRLLRQGEQLSLELAKWVADVVEDNPKPRNTRKARRPRQDPPNWERDHLIRQAILYASFMFDRDLMRSGSVLSRQESACDIVAEAFGLKYKNVERIWRERRRSS